MGINNTNSINCKCFYPKISIVTPSFNQGKYIEKTILSVIAQNYPNLEYIIIDGGSTDNSVEIIEKYEKYLKYWVSESDRGQSHAINKGLAHATGDILGWLNSDDYLTDHALETVAEMYRCNPNAGAYVGAGEFVNCEGKILKRKEPCNITQEVLYRWLEDYFVMQPSCFFSKKAWIAVKGLDESVHFAMDVDLWLKISKNFSFESTNKLLSRSLVHNEAKTKAYKSYCKVDTALVIIRNGGEQYAREYLEQIAAKLDFFERCLRPLTSNCLFAFFLPYIKRMISYENKMNLRRPWWKR